MIEKNIKKLYSTDKRLYSKGAPVIIERASLTVDAISENRFLQIEFKNISSKTITRLKVIVSLKSISGRIITQAESIYPNLSEQPNTVFGSNFSILVPDKSVKSFALGVSQVIFEDGEKWTASDTAKWTKIPTQADVRTKFTTEESLEEFKSSYCANAKYVPLKHKDIWLCACGGVNQAKSDECVTCGANFKAMNAATESGLLMRKIYKNACELVKNVNEADFYKAIFLFEQIPEYRDSSRKIEQIKQQISALRAGLEVNVADIIPSSYDFFDEENACAGDAECAQGKGNAEGLEYLADDNDAMDLLESAEEFTEADFIEMSDDVKVEQPETVMQPEDAELFEKITTQPEIATQPETVVQPEDAEPFEETEEIKEIKQPETVAQCEDITKSEPIEAAQEHLESVEGVEKTEESAPTYSEYTSSEHNQVTAFGGGYQNVEGSNVNANGSQTESKNNGANQMDIPGGYGYKKQSSGMGARMQKPIIIAVASVVLVAVITIIVANVLLPKIKLTKAQEYYEAGEYEMAMETIENYRDSKEASDLYKRARYMKKGDYGKVVKMDDLTEFTVPSDVKTIKAGAFMECQTLTSVTLPKKLKAIEEAAFAECSRLQQINLPEGLESIGKEAFCECSSLTTVILPSTLTELGEDAFLSCHRLVEVVNRSEHINVYAHSELYNVPLFYDYTTDTFTESKVVTDKSGFVSITLTENVATPIKVLINYVGSSTTVRIPSDVNVIYNYALYQGNYSGNNIKQIIIPSSVYAIGDHAFGFCHLESIIIPSSVAYMGQYVFGGCNFDSDTILKVYCEASGEPSNWSWAWGMDCDMNIEWNYVSTEIN